jgi:TetR/AcrR family transcriptional repressor of mexJK operon
VQGGRSKKYQIIIFHLIYVVANLARPVELKPCGSYGFEFFKTSPEGSTLMIDDVLEESSSPPSGPRRRTSKADGRHAGDRPAFKPKVGRPSVKQAAAITRAIIEEATRGFLTHGFDAVSMEAIAANTGIARDTLYSRFPSKAALMHAVIDDCVRRWGEAEPTPSDPDEEIMARLRRYGRIIAHLAADPEVGALARLTIGNGRRFPEIARSVRQLGYSMIVKKIADDIRAAAINDGIPVFDPEDVAQRLIATINGWVLAYPDCDIPVSDVERFADRTVQLMMAARPLW